MSFLLKKMCVHVPFHDTEYTYKQFTKFLLPLNLQPTIMWVCMGMYGGRKDESHESVEEQLLKVELQSWQQKVDLLSLLMWLFCTRA